MAKLTKRQTSPATVDDDNPEWTAEDFAKARPAAEVLTEIFPKTVAAAMLKPRGRPRKEITKAPVNIRLSPDVVEAFRATGRGWQTRVDEALKDWLKSHKRMSHN